MRALPLLLALALAAGCVGKGDGSESAASVSDSIAALAGPSEAELAATAGVLQGVVHTAALEPIANATLLEPRLSLQAVTDASGAFSLPGLVTGEHLLTISAPGYVTRSVTVTMRNGTTLTVDVLLARAPSTVPYAETRELKGFLACSILVADEARDCASADPNHRDAFEFEIGASGKSAVLELTWDPASAPAAKRMRLLVETVGYGAQDIELGNATGEGYARIEVSQAIMEKYYPEGGVMRALVSLAPSDAPASVAAQVSFIVYATTFYHMAGPSGYTVVSSP